MRWQQQQMSSFMAEVRELIRPDGVLSAAATDDEQNADAPAPVESVEETPAEGADAPAESAAKADADAPAKSPAITKPTPKKKG